MTSSVTWWKKFKWPWT